MTLPADQELDEILEGGALEGAFFFHGDASALRDEAAERLADGAVDPSTRDFNLDRFRGDEVEAEELASALSTPPMMADRRVVVLTDAQELRGKTRTVVEEAATDPPSGLTLIVTARVPDGSKASLYRVLRSEARTLEWSAPAEAELPGWLMQHASARHGYRLEPSAAQALAAAVGTDLDVLGAELGKLASAAEGDAVGVETVRRLVPTVREVDRWEWLDRVASREYDRALRELPRLLAESSESAVGLLVGMVDQHLYLGVALEGGRQAVADALTRSGKRYLKWKARIYARQSRAWSGGELRRALRLMRRADGHAKSGLGDRRVLEELLLELQLLKERAA